MNSKRPLSSVLPMAVVVALISLATVAKAGDPLVSESAGLTPRPSPGCLRASRMGDPATMTTHDGADVARTYEVHPPRDSGAGPVPLVIAFHGQGGHAADAVGYGFEDVPGARDAALFVYPEGRDFKSFGRGWDDSCQGYDMLFFDRMVRAVEERYCVDEGRVFVAGFSWGCDFATALACCRGEKIRGIAAAACSDEFQNPADPATYINGACPAGSKTAVRFTHQETADPAYPAPLFATTSAFFRSLNACTAIDPAPVSSQCVAYRGCRQGVTECSFKAIGHAVGPNWAAQTWAFFSELR